MLIVNADDFGISEGVNVGIVEAHRRGILTSTTIMANMPAFDHAARLARETPSLGVGIHLNLTSGTPVLPPAQIPTLVGREGKFHPLAFVLNQLNLGRFDREQVETELNAQVERAFDAGLSPTHLDSHHHVHVHPRLQPLAILVAQHYGIRAIRATAELDLGAALRRSLMLLHGAPETEAGAAEEVVLKAPLTLVEGMLRALPVSDKPPAEDVPVEENDEGRSPTVETPRQLYLKAALLSLLGTMLRWRARRAGLASPDHFRGLLLGPAFSAEELREVLEKLPAGSTELMCHPGYVDGELRQRTSYSEGREFELAALLDPAQRATLDRVGVRLGSFADLQQ